MQWVEECHGDSYSSFLSNGIVYAASHSHYCGNEGDGAPQYEQWRFQHAMAWSDTTTGEVLNDPLTIRTGTALRPDRRW